ncbi:hypothetical protein AeNC1_019379, partial [Aphanomyces euteiches]
MATAAPPAINLAKANPAKHDQTAKLANEPTGELADVDMAPAGPAKSAPTPQPTAKAKEPGQTQTGSKDSTSTSSHSDATGSISMQQENPKIQKICTNVLKKPIPTPNLTTTMPLKDMLIPLHLAQQAIPLVNRTRTRKPTLQRNKR